MYLTVYDAEPRFRIFSIFLIGPCLLLTRIRNLGLAWSGVRRRETWETGYSLGPFQSTVKTDGVDFACKSRLVKNNRTSSYDDELFRKALYQALA